MSKQKIFVSYAMVDRRFVQKALDELKLKGLIDESDEILLDENVTLPGASLRGNLREVIQAASKVVLIWSGDAARSQWVNYEVGMADALGKPIFVVIPHHGQQQLPSNLSHTQVIQLET